MLESINASIWLEAVCLAFWLECPSHTHTRHTCCSHRRLHLTDSQCRFSLACPRGSHRDCIGVIPALRWHCISQGSRTLHMACPFAEIIHVIFSCCFLRENEKTLQPTLPWHPPECLSRKMVQTTPKRLSVPWQRGQEGVTLSLVFSRLRKTEKGTEWMVLQFLPGS